MLNYLHVLFSLHFCFLLLTITERTSMLFSEQALRCLLQLLDKEVSEHSRHLVQYFQVFCSYAHRGSFEVRINYN